MAVNHTAIQTLWGSGDPERDQKRRNTAKSMISPPEKATGGTRPQTIYTPQKILDVVAKVWPEGIALDPCSGPESIVPAALKYTEEDDGLKCNWFSRCFVNPPYKTLKVWLAKCREEGTLADAEIILLGPVRTHRRWWRNDIATASAVSFLDPLCFRGYTHAFPAPLFLAYWGTRVDAFNAACVTVSKP